MSNRFKVVLCFLPVIFATGSFIDRNAFSLFAQKAGRFRGDNGQGIYNVSNVPVNWTSEDFAWKTALPGKGHSSPVMWGDRIFVASADEDRNMGRLFALSANDGKILWQQEHEFAPYKINSLNSYASITPTVDAKHVYILWFSEKTTTLSALSHSGEHIWTSEFDGVYSRHGVGASPIVVDDVVVFTREQEEVKKGPFISEWFAVDCMTGGIRWRLQREMVKSNSQSTPIVMRHQEKWMLLFTSEAHGFSGVDIGSGAVLWEFNPFDSRAISSPVLAGDLILGACKSRLFAVKPGEDNGGEVAYKLEHKYSPYVPTPLFKDGLLFSFTDTGNISCHLAATGEVIWREKPADGFYASPIFAAGNLYGVTRTGKVVVLKMGKKYSLLAVNDLGEGTHATPVAVDGALIFRTFSHLICFRSK